MGNNLQIAKLTRTYKYKNNSVICIAGIDHEVGQEIAIQYSKRVCRLFLIGKNQETLDQVQVICQNHGSQVKTLKININLEENCKECINQCIEQFGQLDILYLTNENKQEFVFELQENIDIYKEMMIENYYSAIYLTKYSWKYLNQSQGQIVVLSSLGGEIGLPNHSAYCGSKFALTGFFESLRIEQTNPKGSVAITIVCPPLLNTNNQFFSLLNDLKNNTKTNFAINYKLSINIYVSYIMQGADLRIKKLLFPTRSYIAAYMRPFFPNIVDRYIKLRSKL